MLFSTDKIRKLFNVIFSLEQGHNYKDSIFLAGVGRSGTTWVSDVINHNNEYRYIHEPFHPHRVRQVKHFQYMQYLRPQDKDPELTKTAETILSGRFRGLWTDADNTTIFSSQRLIKDIRANFLLRWLYENFWGMPIILLFRHPCAVANSWLKLGWGTEESGTRSDIEICLSQKELMDDFLEPFKNDIQKAKDDFEKHVFLWCIQYYVPLRQFRPGEIHLAFYEELCENPEKEIQRLFSFIGKELNTDVFDKLKIPSSVIRKESPIVTGNDMIKAWKDQITEEQTKKAIEILNLFGLHGIYSEKLMPDMNAADNLLKRNSS